MAETLLRSQQAFGGDGWQPAKGSWSYASADAPTFVITVPSGAASIYNVGDRIKLTQTTVKYFIITAITDTTLTVYGGIDYTLVDAAISLNYYSHQKAPLGFPLSPIKWTVVATDNGNRSQSSPAANTWYNLNAALAITIPIGIWSTSYRVMLDGYVASGTNPETQATLSTANNSESDVYSTIAMSHQAPTGVNSFQLAMPGPTRVLVLAAKTVYYLNARTRTSGQGSISFRGDTVLTVISATCSYL